MLREQKTIKIEFIFLLCHSEYSLRHAALVPLHNCSNGMCAVKKLLEDVDHVRKKSQRPPRCCPRQGRRTPGWWLRTTMLNDLPKKHVRTKLAHTIRKLTNRAPNTHMHYIMTNRSASYRATVECGARGLDLNEQKDGDQEQQPQHDTSTRSRVGIPTMLVW